MNINLIAAIDNQRGIGKDGTIPWNIPDELKYFQQITKFHVVIMGRKTYFSIPEEHRPLKGRMNIVITSNPQRYSQFFTMHPNVSFETMGTASQFIKKHKDSNSKMTIFIIGGAAIYDKFLPECSNIYITSIERNYHCDTYFPPITNNFELVSCGNKLFDETEDVYYRFLKYSKTDSPNDNETKYLNLLKNICHNGNKRDDRTGVGTFSLFGNQLTLDVSKYLPILTTKFTPFKLTIEELLFFIRGDTNSKLLEEKKIKIWQGNTTREFLDNRGLQDYQVGDIGPMYGWQWRHWGANYTGCDQDYTNQGFDQLEEVITLLKNDPFSRRILMSAYNVNDLNKMVLHPCHSITIQFYVDEVDGKRYLSCHTYFRSSDMFLGIPINIVSYTVLLYIVAMKVDMSPKNLIISTGDTHIYLNHIVHATELISRTVMSPPILNLNPAIKDKAWEDIVVDDFELIGYTYSPKIVAEMAI